MLGTCLVVLTACGTEVSSGERPCTMIAAPPGIGLDIQPPYAAKVTDASMKICWNGVCREPDLTLTPTTTAVPQGCTGQGPDAACGAAVSPDGGKHGFANVQGLPTTPVQITVVLRNSAHKPLLTRKLDVTPQPAYPNGKECDKGGPQARLVVTDGRITVHV